MRHDSNALKLQRYRFSGGDNNIPETSSSHFQLSLFLPFLVYYTPGPTQTSQQIWEILPLGIEFLKAGH